MVDAVFDLASIAVVLTLDASGMVSALGNPCFVDAADGVGDCVLGRHDLLASIPQLLFIPRNRLEKSLQRSGGDVLIQRDRLDVLPTHLREQASHVSQQQRPTFTTREAPGETRQKLAEQFAELCDILDAHETAL